MGPKAETSLYSDISLSPCFQNYRVACGSLLSWPRSATRSLKHKYVHDLPYLKPHTGASFSRGLPKLLNLAIKLPRHFMICTQHFHYPLFSLHTQLATPMFSDPLSTHLGPSPLPLSFPTPRPHPRLPLLLFSLMLLLSENRVASLIWEISA